MLKRTCVLVEYVSEGYIYNENGLKQQNIIFLNWK